VGSLGALTLALGIIQYSIVESTSLQYI
jgi:hypothetical protein